MLSLNGNFIKDTDAGSEVIHWSGKPSQWINFKEYFSFGFMFVMGLAIFIFCRKVIPLFPQAIFFAVFGLFLSVICLYRILREFLYIFYQKYTITNQRIIIQTGIFERITHDIELHKIKDVFLREPFILRLRNRGTIELISSQFTAQRRYLQGIKNPIPIKDAIRELVLRRRTEMGVHEIDTSNMFR
ncbi:MAG: PH domain-containing protein [Chitinophagaceae bacterium]|jgi:hypothetical protein|nr:PH domain-containing protein [Chitinophagaceae bacterium]